MDKTKNIKTHIFIRYGAQKFDKVQSLHKAMLHINVVYTQAKYDEHISSTTF